MSVNKALAGTAVLTLSKAQFELIEVVVAPLTGVSWIALWVLLSVNIAPEGTAVLTLSNAQFEDMDVVVAPSEGVSCIPLNVFVFV